METSLRLVLLFIGFVIVAGIFWDTRRHKKESRKSTALRQERISEENDRFSEDLDNISELGIDELEHEENAFEEVVIVNEKSISDPSDSSYSNSPKRSLSAPMPSEMVVMHVMARQPGSFLGKRILEAFQEVHLYHGDRQIFHRYENQDGTGQKIFSVANAIEPGYFDLTKVDSLSTPGIILFFVLTRPNQSIAAFELMLRTAKLLAMRLDGELKDERRRPLTIQMIEQHRERVRNPVLAQVI